MKIYPLTDIYITGDQEKDKTAIIEITSMHGPWHTSIWKETWLKGQSKEEFQKKIYLLYGRISAK